jgi:micrococcal nuclease
MSFRKSLKSISLYSVIGICLIIIGLHYFPFNRNLIVQAPSYATLSPTPTPSSTFAKVTRVIDGDTIVIDTGAHVRYIGMNTPEVETSECFASEATQINTSLVLGKEVKLEKDVSETDKYGRLLRYVYVGTEMINDELVKDGSAKVDTVPPDTKYRDEFLQSEKYARENNLGLWSACR